MLIGMDWIQKTSVTVTKKRNRVQRTRERNIRMTKRFKESIRRNT